MTATDEILAVAASAAGAAEAGAGAAVTVTDADVAAFGEAAARGADSAVVRALHAVRPAGQPWAPPPAAPAGDPAWNAWLTAAAAAEGAARTAWGGGTDGPPHPAWCATFAAGAALGGPGLPVPARAAVAAGLSAARTVESGLADGGGWSSGTVAAGIGAAVTAGLLLGLAPPRLRAALGIAATQAAGLAAAEATPAFALQAGKAAFNGVEAAGLARAGFTAPADPLDGRRGLFALFGPRGTEPAGGHSR